METLTCIDCNCGLLNRTVTCHGSALASSETVFACGARLREFTDHNRGMAKVWFDGCERAF